MITAIFSHPPISYIQYNPSLLSHGLFSPEELSSMGMPLLAGDESLSALPPDCFISSQSLPSPSEVGSTPSDDVPGPSGLSILPQLNTNTGNSGKRTADCNAANSSPAKRHQ